MWTDITRADYQRYWGHYASDMTNRGWRCLLKTALGAETMAYQNRTGYRARGCVSR